MQIVIDIPKEKYDWIMRHLTLDLNFKDCKIIPLPENHGRLIDADKYREEMSNSREFNFFTMLDMQPTIIPATKEGDGE